MREDPDPYEDCVVELFVECRDRSWSAVLPLGQVWRSSSSEELLLVPAEPPDEHGLVPFVRLLDDRGVLAVERGEGLIERRELESDYRLVSDRRAVARA